MAHSMEIADISLEQFSKFVGNRFRNVFEIAKETGIEGFKMKIVKEEDWVEAKWDSVEGVEDDVLLEKVRESINSAVTKFKNTSKKYFYNYLVSYDHSVIGAILKDKGAHMKEFREMLKDKYKLDRFPKVTIVKYDPNMDIMYRAIKLDDLCVDISVRKDGQVKINRYGDCILFKCILSGPQGIRLKELEKDIIRLISKTTDEINVVSDEENSDNE
uniref:Uncharacterized protein n=1 Tax=viral metagenome TaxID=1070528 RepID=A0A6C0CWN7_9ZZZZ